MKKPTIPELVEMKRELVEKHLSNYIETDTGCWEYQGYCARKGYGNIHISTGSRKSTYCYLLHRVSYYYHSNINPASLVVRHDCDNPCCINPTHLRLGTHKDNSRDAVERGRNAKGEKIWNSKLTNDCVINIKKRLREGGETQTKIARDFGVTRSAINNIHLGRGWNHIQLPSEPVTKESHQLSFTM